MTINAGVWIDHHKAVIVLLTDNGEDVLQILSSQGASARSPAGLRAKNSYTPNDFMAEGKRERKVMTHLNEYYDEVIACIRDAQGILILGPGEAKGEFRTRVVSKRLRGHVAEMKTVDRLTDHQIAEYVRQHFQ
jgi:peptide subunit release factor 1 (eRF1)